MQSHWAAVSACRIYGSWTNSSSPWQPIPGLLTLKCWLPNRNPPGLHKCIGDWLQKLGPDTSQGFSGPLVRKRMRRRNEQVKLCRPERFCWKPGPSFIRKRKLTQPGRTQMKHSRLLISIKKYPAISRPEGTMGKKTQTNQTKTLSRWGFAFCLSCLYLEMVKSLTTIK